MAHGKLDNFLLFVFGIKRELFPYRPHDSPRQAETAHDRHTKHAVEKVNERSLFILASHAQVTTHPGACMN